VTLHYDYSSSDEYSVSPSPYTDENTTPQFPIGPRAISYSPKTVKDNQIAQILVFPCPTSGTVLIDRA